MVNKIQTTDRYLQLCTHDNVEPKGVKMRALQICGRAFRGRAQQQQKQRQKNTVFGVSPEQVTLQVVAMDGTRNAKARLPYIIPKHQRQGCLSAAEIVKLVGSSEELRRALAGVKKVRRRRLNGAESLFQDLAASALLQEKARLLAVADVQPPTPLRTDSAPLIHALQDKWRASSI